MPSICLLLDRQVKNELVHSIIISSPKHTVFLTSLLLYQPSMFSVFLGLWLLLPHHIDQIAVCLEARARFRKYLWQRKKLVLPYLMTHMRLSWAKPYITWSDVIEIDLQIDFTFHERLPWQAFLFIGGNPHNLKMPSELKGKCVQSNNTWVSRFHRATSPPALRDGPRIEFHMSESHLFPKWLMISVTGSVI